jgi:hypothetical protein
MGAKTLGVYLKTAASRMNGKGNPKRNTRAAEATLVGLRKVMKIWSGTPHGRIAGGVSDCALTYPIGDRRENFSRNCTPVAICFVSMERLIAWTLKLVKINGC